MHMYNLVLEQYADAWFTSAIREDVTRYCKSRLLFSVGGQSVVWTRIITSWKSLPYDHQPVQPLYIYIHIHIAFFFQAGICFTSCCCLFRERRARNLSNVPIECLASHLMAANRNVKARPSHENVKLNCRAPDCIDVSFGHKVCKTHQTFPIRIRGCWWLNSDQAYYELQTLKSPQKGSFHVPLCDLQPNGFGNLPRHDTTGEYGDELGRPWAGRLILHKNCLFVKNIWQGEIL